MFSKDLAVLSAYVLWEAILLFLYLKGQSYEALPTDLYPDHILFQELDL